jgi:hypothetical protein
MTIDERIERLEHVTAAHIEQARKDYEENRRLWREQQTDIAAIWKRMERGFEESRQADAESRRRFDEGMAEMRKEMAARDQVTDRRIGDLVSAIGDLIRRMDDKNGEKKIQ